MSRMPSAHLLGHQSACAVQKLFADAGCAAEIIKNDYGEDLLVQPQLDGHVDTFQIYVQVKTISRASAEAGRPSVRIDLNHLRRWAHMISPVVLVGYEPSSERFYSKFPNIHRSRYSLIMDERRSATIRFSGEDELFTSTVEQVIWNCRFSYYNNLIVLSLAELDEYINLDEKRDLDNEPADVFLICLALAYQCDLIVEDGVAPSVLELIYREVETGCLRDDDIYSSLMLVTLRHIQMLAGVGLPFNLVKWLPQILAHTLIVHHNVAWNELSSRFPVAWEPFRDMN